MELQNAKCKMQNIKSGATRFYILIFTFLFLATAAFAQPRKNTPAPQTTRILFVFDASFSMFGQWQSGMKMDIAKSLMTEFLDSLTTIPNLEIAFRAYGHQYGLQPQRNCQDSKLEVPFSAVRKNVPLIKQKLKGIVPRGTTPIAYSLEQCAADFEPACPNCRNIVILITDGIEECDGDPCAVSLALQKKGIILKPFVIGIGLDKNYFSPLGCVGKFYDVSSESNFKNVMNIVISQALNNTTVQVNLLDKGGKPTETDVNMTFYDEASGAIKYNYVHTINDRGFPDTLVIDPLLTYRMVVHTLPPVEKSNISITPGKHNIVAVDAPQGSLTVKVSGTNNYKQLQYIVRKAGDMKTVHVQEVNQTEKYIVGKYDLEILTLPRISIPKVDIRQSYATSIDIPQAGMVSINKPSDGPGSIYLEEKNKLTWVCNLKNGPLQENIVLQPGYYRVEFRPAASRESIYTVERRFKVESGSTAQVKLY